MNKGSIMNYSRKADKNLIKQMNMASIMDVIRTSGDISRADIAKTLGLNSATVSNNVTDLINRGYLKETGSGISSGGRKPILLTLDTSKRYIIGIYVGISKIELGLVDLKGQIINQMSISNFNASQIVNCLTESVEELLHNANLDKESIEGIGIGYHGIVDSDRGISLYAPAFNSDQLNIRTELMRTLGLNVSIDNDVRVMAMGEKFFGAAKAYTDFVLINIDQGIGSGMFIDNKIYHGKNFGAGEIGHVKLTNDSIKCRCGKNGCFEAICSVSGILNRYYKISNQSITFDGFLEKLESNDKTCKDLMKDVVEYSLEAFEMIINFLNPEAIILTGKIASLLPETEEMIKRIRDESINNNSKEIVLIKSNVKNLKIVGSASLIYSKIFKIN